MSVGDEWEEYLEMVVDLHAIDYLAELGHYIFTEGPPGLSRLLGLQLYDACQNETITNEEAQVYVEAIERALAGEPPGWT